MATYIPGTNHGDEIAGTLGDDIIDAKGGPDTLSDLAGNDVVMPGNGDDEVHLGPGRDIVEIKPDEGLDQIYGFRSGEDTLMLNGFTSINGYAGLEPHFSSDQEAATVTLDLSAAAGGTAGTQTLTFLKSFGIGEDDIVFATDRLDGGNPNAAKIDPFVPFDPGDVLTEPKIAALDGNDPGEVEIDPFVPFDPGDVVTEPSISVLGTVSSEQTLLSFPLLF
jgi:hypothetical protein